ncbi:MAG: bifunctional phosphopantothenoylcysteine decarboxylase/phosphopantothenate--cysteine ligase CoaBC [Actinobacteria bacterium]|nr:MAG: bifunctional phosphopantothenoylcysteine decarboxylase/phosphopantothenate--cysteine ligase CoaBC [Actinomycetota bacterium]
MPEPYGRRVLLGVTGGIAAYKAALLARLLSDAGMDVTAVLTASATRFVGSDTFSALTGHRAHVSLWNTPGEIIHVRLAHQTDVAVVAPCTANMVAKLALGLADDLLTSTLLEYDGPLVLAPAMHSGMWGADVTQANVTTLSSRGVRFVGPVDGPLAHGDTGPGRMSEPAEIADVVFAALRPRDLDGARVLVTAGPTHEPIDPVRFIGNRSSGKMGLAIAREATARGAAVTLVLGPTTIAPPPAMEVVHVETADEMRSAVIDRFAAADVVVMAAAVADFRPKAPHESKMKKEAGIPDLMLEPTPDILAELGERRRAGQFLVGFAAETDDVEEAGRAKLRSKHLDALVANTVGRDGTGFGSETNQATILVADGRDVPMRAWSKAELASAVCDLVARFTGPR